MTEWRFANGDASEPETNDCEPVARVHERHGCRRCRCPERDSLRAGQIDAFGRDGRGVASAPTFHEPAQPVALAMRSMRRAIRGEGQEKETASPDLRQAWTVERVLQAARRATTERR